MRRRRAPGPGAPPAGGIHPVHIVLGTEGRVVSEERIAGIVAVSITLVIVVIAFLALVDPRWV